MNLLKKPYGLLWLLLSLLTNNLSIFLLGGILNVYNKSAWYAKWYTWCIGFLMGALLLVNATLSSHTFDPAYIAYIFVPNVLLIFIWNIEVSVKVSEKLGVPGKEIYGYPYSWILCIIIPVIGWILLLVMFIYTRYHYIIKIFEGTGEKS